MYSTLNRPAHARAAARLAIVGLLFLAPISKNFGQCSFSQANLPQLTYPALAGNCLLLNQPIPVPAFAPSSCAMAYQAPGLPFQDVPAGATTVTISALPVGPTTIVWAFLVGGNYVDQHPQTILVTDPTPPSFSVCPASISVNLKPNRCDTVLSYAAPQAFDACGLNPPAPVLFTGLPSGGTFPIGTTPIIYRATDNSGNTANCAFNVTVNDFPTTSLQCRDTVKMWFDNTCETVLKSSQILLGSQFGCLSKFDVKIKKTPTGAFVAPNLNANDAGKLYTYQLLNPANNQTCTGKMIARDTTRPVMNCAVFKDTSFTLNALECAVLPNFKLPTVIDNCSIATFTGSPIALSNGNFTKPFPPGVTKETVTAIDASGNKTSCAFTVTVAPWTVQQQLSCIGQLNLSLGPDCTLDIGADALLNGTAYACYDYYEVSLFRGNQWTNNHVGATDVAQNIPYRVYYAPTGQTCWGNVLIEDKFGPVLTSKDTTVQCWQQADELIFGLTGKPTVVEGCGAYSLTFSDSTASLGCSGSKIFRKWTAVDGSGNKGTSLQVITRLAGSLANIVFPKDTILPCTIGTYPGSAVTGFPTLNGNPAVTSCGIGHLYVDSKLPICDGTYKINRLWTVSNFCTNQSIQKNQLITVGDGQGPVWFVPNDTLISSNTGQCCGNFKMPNIRLYDNCSRIKKVEAKVPGANAVIAKLINQNFSNPIARDTVARFDTTICMPSGITTIVFTATDDCGNTSTCSYKVRVRDLTTPVALCPGSSILALSSDDPNDCYLGDVATISAADLSPASKDDCSPIRITAQRIAPLATCINNLNKINGGEPCSDNIPDPVSEYTLATQEATTIKFYCCEIGAPVQVRIKVYQLNPDGTVATFANGQPIVNACTTSVTVQDVTPPTCTPPPNITVQCVDFDPAAPPISSPATPDNCCSPTYTTAWQTPTFFCGGENFRLFTVKDCYNNTSVCSQKVTVLYAPPSYQIKFPDDVNQVGCQSVAPAGPKVLLNTGCTKFKSVYSDSTVAGGGAFCFKILRRWTIYDSCALASPPTAAFVTVANPSASAIGPTVGFGSPDYNTALNAYRYTQEILVNDNAAPEILSGCTPASANILCDSTTNDPTLFNFPSFGDVGETPATVSITTRDGCAGTNVSISYILNLDFNLDGVPEFVINSGAPQVGWGVATVLSGGNKIATVQSPSQNLPYGRHIITWTMADQCGNSTTCRDTLIVRDCLPPNAVCKSNFTKTMTASKSVTVLATDLNNGSTDNMTAAAQLQFAMRVKGTGTGFPTTTSITFNCLNLGAWTLEMWVKDLAGNASKCEVTVTITDPSKFCSSVAVSGFVKNNDGDGLDHALINFGNDTQADLFGTAMTDQTGLFNSPGLPGSGDVHVKPVKDNDPLNGVSTFDLVAMSKHVLNVAPFTQPWQFIAADINRNNQVTTFDIVELRKLILGIYPSFPANSSWRFVPKSWVFQDPTNPFSPPFPEKSVLDSALIAQGDIDFLAIKTGDLTGDAQTSLLPGESEERGLPPFIFKIEDREFSAGENLTANINFDGEEQLGGCQFTLDFDPAILELADLKPGTAMADFNFNLTKKEAGKVSASWDGEAGKPSFSLIFNALRGGRLSESISFGDEITRREAFFKDGKMAEPVLKFSTEKPATGDRLLLFQNVPNPFSGRTEIAFFNPAPAPVVLKISDATGRLLFQKTILAERGRQVFSIEKSELGAADGLLWYSIQTPTEKAVRRMTVID